MTIKITCKCGEEFTAPDPGETECPGCGTVYTVTDRDIKWRKNEQKANT